MITPSFSPNWTLRKFLRKKETSGDFDVFLCYNSEDRAMVINVGKKLKLRKIHPWLDEWELQPGLPWQQVLESQIEIIKSAAVFIGANGLGPWQDIEINSFLREFIRRRCPVIPIILENATTKPQLPLFLNGMTWVDFRKNDPDPIEQLVWGITGRKRSFD